MTTFFICSKRGNIPRNGQKGLSIIHLKYIEFHKFHPIKIAFDSMLEEAFDISYSEMSMKNTGT